MDFMQIYFFSSSQPEVQAARADGFCCHSLCVLKPKGGSV